MPIAQAAASSPAGPPPEIGLTQHHLPDEPPDPRLALVIDPDSERAAAFRVLRHHLLEVGRPQVRDRVEPAATATARPRPRSTSRSRSPSAAAPRCCSSRPTCAGRSSRTIFKFVPPWCFAEQLAAHRHQPMMPWSLIEIPQLWLHVARDQPADREDPAARRSGVRDRDGAPAARRLRPHRDRRAARARLRRRQPDGRRRRRRACSRCARRRSTTRDLRRAIEQLGADKVAGTVLVQD